MSDQPVLQVENLYKQFVLGRRGAFQRGMRAVRALDGIDIEIAQGEVLALVGESGCGKSTLALTLMGLEEPTEGRILFNGGDVTHLNPGEMKALRRRIQMIFQDPYESLNPMMTIGEIVAEPLQVHGMAGSQEEVTTRVYQALEDAGLKPAEIFADRLPHELSGGQRQRVVIAGALVLEPAVLLADEPVSMLDVSIRAEILNLLGDLRQLRGITVLYITHDLGTVAYIADRIAVMYLGRIVEIGPTHEVLGNPQHPYTRALLSVVPVPNPRLRRERTILEGETPDPIDVPGGCRFHPRCPAAFERCPLVDPLLYMVSPTHQAACLLVNDGGKLD
jgi:oligopeptide/dipeptide ABC transporter ATP-binding protein